ncbi:uncharacterized protein LOC6541179 [Drosophila erecta]|uniref:Uncharacterized protein n=1 Tax=Drosophila erecta TaxID=7220 RepID=B3NAY8_DROER|nr:uncharacterized protein LOC6541179 [Drosophila erecta]EDV58702.1 uncharacterized protein Dere_GG23839 [Drosophila erecta]
MLGVTRSVSAPNFSVRSVGSYSSKSNYEANPSLLESQFSEGERFVEACTSIDLFPKRRKPSTCIFRAYVFLLLVIQVVLASLQWVGSTYRWRPQLNAANRGLSVLLLLLSWINLTLAFIGFRRLQFTFPLNWIIFGCMFESLTLLVVCLHILEQDLTWPFVLIGIAVLVVYTLLGLWVPGFLTANLWILILASIVVFLVSTVALSVRLEMRYYVPASVCLVFFGPWAMYNSQKLFLRHKRSRYLTHQYMEASAKMFINYAFTVSGIIFAHRFSVDTLDAHK